MSEFTVKKSKVERYDIRFDGENRWRCRWATVWISEDGFFNAQTDCGDFSYRWNSFGGCFKSFLIAIDKEDYLYGKIAKDTERVDAEESVKQIKIALLEKRRRREITRDVVDLSWGDIEELIDECDGQSAEVFYCRTSSKFWLTEKALPELFDFLEIDYKPDRAAKVFCEVVMPVFVEVLRKEIAEKETG